MDQRQHFFIDIILPVIIFNKGRSAYPVHPMRPLGQCIFLCAFFVCAGCSTVRTSKEPDVAQVVPRLAEPRGAPLEAKPAVKKNTPPGIIFGKADFRGLLKVQYVKMNIVDEDNPEKQYELLFGDRDENNAPVWDARPIEPHYFFLELPVGKYRIKAISIPVGTTLATETTDIIFIVERETVIYLGTLRVTGTDQKIRFGGVPLLRPGFAYKVEIINEIDEAVHKFRLKYPSVKREIQVELMRAMRVQTF